MADCSRAEPSLNRHESKPVCVPLNQLRPGQSGVVRQARVGADEAALLGAMGLSCNAKVRLCRAGEPCIVAVTTGRGAGCRIGLARPLAESILVDPV